MQKVFVCRQLGRYRYIRRIQSTLQSVFTHVDVKKSFCQSLRTRVTSTLDGILNFCLLVHIPMSGIQERLPVTTCHESGYISEESVQVKSRKYQGVFEVKSRVKTWQVRGIWSQQLEH